MAFTPPAFTDLSERVLRSKALKLNPDEITYALGIAALIARDHEYDQTGGDIRLHAGIADGGHQSCAFSQEGFMARQRF